MVQGPSRTAIGAAVARGVHRVVDDRPWILDDWLALELVGPHWERVAEATRERYPDEVARELRASIVTRSRYAEDRLLGGTFDQYVLLGAGLDSFAWRRPADRGGIHVFEVDHPASLAWKLERAARLERAPVANHDVVPVDFEAQRLDERLVAAGFDPRRATLFAWLGVTPYLTSEAVEATLRAVATCAPGTEVVMEYALTDEFVDDTAREFRRAFTPNATSLGEPVRSAFAPSGVVGLVERCGLDVVDHPDRDELVDRYFEGRTDGLRPWNVSGLLTARVPSPLPAR